MFKVKKDETGKLALIFNANVEIDYDRFDYLVNYLRSCFTPENTQLLDDKWCEIKEKLPSNVLPVVGLYYLIMTSSANILSGYLEGKGISFDENVEVGQLKDILKEDFEKFLKDVLRSNFVSLIAGFVTLMDIDLGYVGNMNGQSA